MTKNQNTFAKRQRERLKKEKAQMKRERKLSRKQADSIQPENTEGSELSESADFVDENVADLDEGNLEEVREES